VSSFQEEEEEGENRIDRCVDLSKSWKEENQMDGWTDKQ